MQNIGTVFVANRGEAALRIVRACRDLGLTSVVGYSEPDRDSPAVRLADDGFCLGPGPAARSYLSVPAIMHACAAVGADAVHPGWGFLSENADFAQMCEQVDLTFIGPSSTVIRRLSDKIAARALAESAGLPVAPGTGALSSLDEARARAAEIGFPLMLKAAAGGGGRGISVIRDDADLQDNFLPTVRQAEALFLDSRVYLEKRISACRHIEVQILADRYGNVVHLGERDCTIQRRNQKMIEESPSSLLDMATREALCDGAVAGARAAGYVNAGTFEFLVDRHGQYTFMEANTRLQVEHGVSEMRTGIDLVSWMIRIADGERLSLTQPDIHVLDHIIECRVTAEDPNRGFLPQAGLVESVSLPGGTGVRVDSDLACHSTIHPFYDSLLAKIIVRGRNRTEALSRMRRALDELRVEGVPTSRRVLEQVLSHPEFVDDEHTTDFLDRRLSGAGVLTP